MPWGKDEPVAVLTKARCCLYKRKVVCQKRFRDIFLKVF